MLLFFRKIFLLLGWIKEYKSIDLYLLRSHHKKFYKVLECISQGQGQTIKYYPLEGNKRLYLTSLNVDYNDNIQMATIWLQYAPREANLVKYKAVNEKSFIRIRIDVDQNNDIHYRSFLNYEMLGHTFLNFEPQFYSIMGKILSERKSVIKDLINLDGYGDLLVLYNKILSFNDLDAESEFLCIGRYDLDPITEIEDTKIIDYQGVSQFNLVVYLYDGIGNPIIVKSYHQDNKLKMKVKDCAHKVKMDLMKISGTIDDINYMLDDTSKKNLGLYIDRDYDTGEVFVSSNDTKIISFNTEDDFNSFVDGAKESFLRIIKTGICVINYEGNRYTCFKGVLNNGIIEYIAISGDVRIQAMVMKYDPIRLRN